MNTSHPPRKIPTPSIFPAAGIALFFALYGLAARLYPGGSRHDPSAAGFSMLHNYWCDLFDHVAPNGQANPGRPVAIAAMFVLAASLGALWYRLPALFPPWNRRSAVIRYTGLGASAVTTLLFTTLHEVVIHVAGWLGSVAVAVTMAELYRTGRRRLLAWGAAGLVLGAVNYGIYQTRVAIDALPLLQKLTFLVFFGWAGALQVALYRGRNSAGPSSIK